MPQMTPMAIRKKSIPDIIYSFFNRYEIKWRKINRPIPIKDVINLNFSELIWVKSRVTTDKFAKSNNFWASKFLYCFIG